MTGNRTSYPYVRAVELEGRHPHDVGAWLTTTWRIGYGEGIPIPGSEGYTLFTIGDELPPTPRLPRDLRFPQYCAGYRQLRTPRRLADYVAAGNYASVCLPLTAAWVRESDGPIPMPTPSDVLHAATHCVEIDGVDRARRRFEFNHKWEEWQRGSLPYEYVAEYAFELMGPLLAHKTPLQSRRQAKLAGYGGPATRLAIGMTGMEHGDRLHFSTILDGEGDRLGWTFLLETGGTLEVEELYVRPEFRGNGYGRVLTDEVLRRRRALELRRRRRLTLRLRVPWSDSKQEAPGGYGAIIAAARRLDLRFRPSDVRWAAYLADESPVGSRMPIEPAFHPVRPRVTFKTLESTARAVALAAAVAVSSVGTHESVGDPPPRPAPVSTGVFVVNHATPADAARQELARMNPRRFELIRKSVRASLTDDEGRELDDLQRRSLALGEAISTGPVIDVDRIERVARRIAGRAGE